MSALARFFALPGAELGRTMEAALWLLLVRLEFGLLPFRWALRRHAPTIVGGYQSGAAPARPPQAMRIAPPTFEPAIRMDDWRRSAAELVPAAEWAPSADGERIAATFLKEPVLPFVPVNVSVL